MKLLPVFFLLLVVCSLGLPKRRSQRIDKYKCEEKEITRKWATSCKEFKLKWTGKDHSRRWETIKLRDGGCKPLKTTKTHSKEVVTGSVCPKSFDLKFASLKFWSQIAPPYLEIHCTRHEDSTSRDKKKRRGMVTSIGCYCKRGKSIFTRGFGYRTDQSRWKNMDDDRKFKRKNR